MATRTVADEPTSICCVPGCRETLGVCASSITPRSNSSASIFPLQPCMLFHQYHFPGLNEASGCQAIDIDSAGKSRTVKTHLIGARCLARIDQYGDFSSQQIIHDE